MEEVQDIPGLTHSTAPHWSPRICPILSTSKQRFTAENWLPLQASSAAPTTLSHQHLMIL